MLRPGTQESYISRKVNMPTEKSHAELVRDIEPKIKAQSFFSARVAEAHILDKLREVSDGYSRGEFGLGEARNKLKDFLRGEGYDPHQAGLRNLASTARLNLILKQNAAMAHSAAEWHRMHDPDAMKVFPYVRYHARNDSRTRGEHAHLDGRIFRKDDPYLQTHTPPWEFNCRCWLEEITEKEAGKTPDLIQAPTPEDKVTVDSRSGFRFDPAHAFEEYDLQSVKNPEVRGNIREEAEIEFGDQVHFMADNVTANFDDKQYKTFSDQNLPSAKEWTAAPAPKRIAPDEARQKLEAGFEVTAGDGRKVIMDQAVLDHWTVENNKLQSDIDSRLACLDYAVETLQFPSERWDQETQSRYLKKFQKATGGFEGCMVVVTNDGKCRTYFLPSVSKLDKSRVGISYEVMEEVESSTGRNATQTTEVNAAPGHSDDRTVTITPEEANSSAEFEKNPEKTVEKLKKLAKVVDLKIKKSDAETADQFVSVLESRMETFKIPAFSRLQAETQKNTVGGVLGDKFSVNLSVLKNSEKRWKRMKADADKHGGQLWTFAADKDDLARAFVDHEIGHVLLTRSGKMNQVAAVFGKAGISHPKLDAKGNVIRNDRGIPVMTMDALEISRYANNSDPHEFFAEAFNKYMSSKRDELPEYIRQMIEEVIGLV